MSPFQDPTRPERGPMNLDDSDLQGLGETYRPLCAQRQWDAKPDRWIERAGPFLFALVLVLVAAAAVCVFIGG